MTTGSFKVPSELQSIYQQRFDRKMAYRNRMWQVLVRHYFQALIPADAAVRRALRGVRPGALIQLSGQLVEVHSPKGWTIRSSMTRDDTGAGACEVVWVEALQAD